MADSQEAVVKIRWEMDTGGAVRAVDSITGRVVKMSSAYEEVRKRIERTTREMELQKRVTEGLEQIGVKKGPAAPPTFEQKVGMAEQAYKERERMQAALLGRGIGVPVAPLTVQQEAQQRATSMARAAQVQQELVRMGIRPGPAAGPDTSAGAGIVEATGLGSLRTMMSTGAGRVFLATAAARSVGQAAVGLNQVERDNPFANDRLKWAKRYEAAAGSVPFVGDLIGKAPQAMGELWSGVSSRQAGFERQTALEDIRARSQAERDTARHEFQTTHGVRTARAEMFGDLRLARPTGFDRGTVMGKKLDEEEERMLAIKRQHSVAAIESLSAEKKVHRSIEEEAKYSNKLADLRDELARVTAVRKSSDLWHVQNAAAEREGSLLEQIGIVSGQRLQASKNTVAAREEAAQRAQDAMRLGRVAPAEQRYATLREREQTAAGQAQSLAALGPEGRLRGELSLRLLRQMGTANAPAELQSEAASYAPQLVREMQEKAGSAMRERAASYSPEFRDDLTGVRKEADAAREDMLRAHEEVGRASAGLFADAIDKAFEAHDREIEKRMAELEHRLESNAFRRNQ